MRGLIGGCGAAVALTLGLLATGCDDNPSFRKSGADAAQTNRDYDDCRAKVNAYLAKDRGIDEDRSASVAGGGIAGAGGVRRQMDGSTDGRRSNRLMRDCMAQKGYAGGEPDRGGIRW